MRLRRVYSVRPNSEGCLVVTDVNTGPPSEASSSGIPDVTNVRLRYAISSAAPYDALSTIGQFKYRSTTTKYTQEPLIIKEVRIGMGSLQA